ncbi:hypothetical protein K474DRAFT_1590474 [Panus rudis PR-1116 ss-1]|nr:hypothetical protein K474DRAFT_1590474 [Panus rudis PR-1116 ss-1]
MASPSTARDKNRRRNGPLSCAECRRSVSLACSRVFPCESCVRKGCGAICPNGSLTTGKGNRFVLANTEELHEKISVLSTRVRELEDALQDVWRTQSSEPHPLLSPDLLQLKRPLERESSEAIKEQEVDPSEVIDAVGSLSITESGQTKFFGTTANAWYLLQNEAEQDDEEGDLHLHMPTDLPWLNHAFPLATAVGESAMAVRASLLKSLPDMRKARHMAEIYYRHAAWMYTPIPESEFLETVFNRVYNPQQGYSPDPIDSHRLAVLYLVFALGTLLDLDLPPLSTEASEYYQLGRAALSLESILESQSIPAIQALVLMSHYMFLAFIEGPRWALMGLAVKLAQSVYRDSGKWHLQPKEAHRRRSLMWELFTYDAWQSLTFGRPPSFSMAYIDCQMSEDTTKNENGEVEMSFAAWKHRFSSRCMAVVQEQAFGARVPNYRTIQELDKKVRNFYVPPSLQVPGFSGAKLDINSASQPVELTMQRYIAYAIKEMTIFYLHRGFFAKSVEDHMDDPLGSRYAPSFLAAYNSACSFVGLVKSLHSLHPALTERMWFLFTHVFSCTIVLGSIPTKCPRIPLARSALSHLNVACTLFEQVSSNARAAIVLPVLRKLKDRAAIALQDSQSNNTRFSPESTSGREDDDDELTKLGGKTRLVSRKSPSSPTAHAGPSSPIISTPSPPSQPMMHPLPQENGLQELWSSYAPTQEAYQYPSYASMPEQWQAENVYHSYPDPSTMVMDHSFAASGHGQQLPMMNSYHEGQPLQMNSLSPVMPMTGSEPEASWRNLFAQLNHT